MRDFKQIIHRASIQNIRSFLLDGIEHTTLSEKLETDSYEERLQEGEAPLWEFLENLYPDGDKRDYVYHILCKAILTNQEVYTELGIRLGANLVFELLQSNPLKELESEGNTK